MARRTLTFLYFPIGKSAPTTILVGSPSLLIGRSDFVISRIQWSSVRSSNPRDPIQVDADLFLYLIGTSPIMILALAMSSHSSYRLSNPDTPITRHAQVDFSTSLSPRRDFDFSISRILMSMFRDFSLRNLEMVCQLSTSPTPVAPHYSRTRWDIAFHDFTISSTKSSTLPSRNPDRKFHE
jgi:hypothetical protein